MRIRFLNNDTAEFEEIRKIRNSVFELEQGAIADEEFDTYDSDEKTIYALIYDDNKPIATGRIAITSNGYKIGRIAVVRQSRGSGVGTFLVNSLCDKAEEMGAMKIFVDSQLHAVEFYKKLGFVPTGDNEITDRGIVHLPMRKEI